MQTKTYYMVDASALPEVFAKVIEAKTLIENKTAANASEAIKMAGLSRSAYYKYKDKIFLCKDNNTNKLDIQAILQDKAGVFSTLSNILFKNGANIVTMNQSAPQDGLANVSIMIDIGGLKSPLEQLIKTLEKLDGVISIKTI